MDMCFLSFPTPDSLSITCHLVLDYKSDEWMLYQLLQTSLMVYHLGPLDYNRIETGLRNEHAIIGDDQTISTQ
jgi:hypothetical protein